MGLTQLFYLSHVRGDKPFATIAQIVSQARVLNRERGISGVLVFDGAHVCQYVEGASESIDALAARLAADPRHERMQVLHRAALDGPRRFARWRMGYLSLDDGQDLTAYDALRGPAAVEALLAQLPHIDLEP